MKTLEQYIEQYGEIEGPKKYKLNLYRREWYQKHGGYAAYRKKVVPRELNNKYCREYQARHREPQRQRVQKYHETPEGRCTNLFTSYRQFDAERFGVMPQLTREQVLIKTMREGCKCVYCGKEIRWTELGLDRISNNLPHHTWNTVCCCKKCNNKRNRKTFEEFLESIGLTFQEWMEKNNGEFSEGVVICY